MIVHVRAAGVHNCACLRAIRFSQLHYSVHPPALPWRNVPDPIFAAAGAHSRDCRRTLRRLDAHTISVLDALAYWLGEPFGELCSTLGLVRLRAEVRLTEEVGAAKHPMRLQAIGVSGVIPR